jgi:protein-arginine kinase activator protein McsA
MICQNCEVNAAQFHVLKYENEESNNIISEWYFCENPCLDTFAATIPDADAELYGIENLWS